MAQIFVAYAREDEARIGPLVNTLNAEGWSVFWDRRIPAGQTWRSYIGAALNDARCVIVVWSLNSIASSWVSEEADEGKRRNILVPVIMDSVEPPMGFRSIQAADLTEWDSDRQSPRFRQLCQDIRAVINADPRPEPKVTFPEPNRSVIRRAFSSVSRNRLPAVVVMTALAAIVGVLGFIFWLTFSPTGDIGNNDNRAVASTSQGPVPSTTHPPPQNRVPANTAPSPHSTGAPEVRPQLAPHAPSIEINQRFTVWGEKLMQFYLDAGESKTIKGMELYADVATYPSSTCAGPGFVAYTWRIRQPYPQGGDLDISRVLMGGATEQVGAGSVGRADLGYCEEHTFKNNGIEKIFVEIRYASYAEINGRKG